MCNRMKIYRSNENDILMNNYHAHFLPFDLESRKWSWTTEMDDAEVIAVLNKSNPQEIKSQIETIRASYNNQTIAILSLFHIDQGTDISDQHNYQLNLWRDLTENLVIVHTNLENKSNIFYDFLWNRQKCYFTEYDNFSLHDRVWTWGSTRKMFDLLDVKKTQDRKLFLSPNRIYYQSLNHPRIRARLKLKRLLGNKNGFVSDPQKGVGLEPEEISQFGSILEGQGGTWLPVANRYYNASYVSIYVETITTGIRTKTITEKTWDPLIKGHFVLPFGYCGLIKDIESYGFKMPKWIDYSYDQELDDNRRWQKYEQSVKNILKKSLEEIDDLYQKDKEILEQNRNIFFTRPYDTLYDKIKQFRLTHIADKNLS
jgi:hypothetical protein